ncbi:MAG: hypothetical protein CALGDGBN_02330 [Pseudomonadales bacterium]|nr:hypothetical protein [Pseudomonadales bacterium]
MVAQIDKTYFRYTGYRAARRLLSYALFEGRPVTTRGRTINTAVFLWLRALANIPGSPAVPTPIFIVGLGRSGTTLLGVLLSVHRQVAYLNEPKALWHVVDPRQDINGNYSACGGEFRLGDKDVTPVLAAKGRRLFARYLRMVGGTTVVDKYPEMIFRVDYLKRIFPHAKFIFITRNGRDAIASVATWSDSHRVVNANRKDDWWGRDDIKWRYICNQLILNHPAYKSVWPLVSGHVDPLNRAAIEWVVTMDEGVRQQRNHPESFVRVAYEDLVADPEFHLIRLLDFCGLDFDRNVIEYAKVRAHSGKVNALPNLNNAVAELFDGTMKSLGY